MCICWGFPVLVFKPRDPMCYGNIVNRETMLKCRVTLTHKTKWNFAWEGETKLTEPYDPSTCSTAKYPAPQGAFWACSGGKTYSHLHVHEMAGLRCTVGIPSMCPSRTFDFIDPKYNRRKWDVQTPQAAPEWVRGVRAPDYYTRARKAALAFEAHLAPGVLLQRHQFVLEKLTWQVHILSNWTARAFGELNLQVQQVLKMALQNRLALDMLLVKEQGVCGVLNHTAGECCVTIHNATTTIEEARQRMQEITDEMGGLFQSMLSNEWKVDWNPASWISTLLKKLGLAGWWDCIVEALVILLLILIGLAIGFAIIRCLISRLLASLSPSIRYVQITTVEEDLGVFEPRGGVRDEAQVTVL